MVNSFLQVRFLNSSSLGRADLLFGSLKDGLSAGLAIAAIKSLEADTGLDGGLDGVFVSKMLLALAALNKPLQRGLPISMNDLK